MKITIFLLSLISFSALAQSPELDNWMFNTTGAGATYEYYTNPPNTATTQITLNDSSDILQSCYSNNYIFVRSNGLPSHHMGPWLMNPNQPGAQPKTFRIPRNPTPATNNTDQPFAGPMALAVNGVVLYGAGDARSYSSTQNANVGNGDGLWNGDAWASEGETMDPGGAGHADGQDNYHYHATPVALFDDPANGHSPIIGWSFDGYPIYGPYGYSDPNNASSSIVRIESGYGLRSISDRTILPDGSTSNPAGPAINGTFPLGTYWEDYEFKGTGHLDEHNGRTCVTPEYPGGTYAYFVTMDASGEPQYPYLIGPTYYGEVNTSDIGPSAGSANPTNLVGCKDGSSPVGINELEMQVQLYPNPFQNVVNIVGVQSGTYKVYDVTGRVHATGTIVPSIDLSNLVNGNYWIEILGDKEIIVKQLLKN